ncbi:hypothetical protein RO3G_10091 [Rhizopus delemar RA 99-880]|uniref:Type 1 phosphatases regulator n=3 Tax=Rhizopus TaxID=4842 RepID=I1CAA1_RHIO9|nr:hypothetical protein RO3G_10091 [Rhizopus delemar RA 99-880]|eukprot:EIE85381.1 hypothetical protein RO3G_10091 [Rhizopus delemar RA 99-880]
MNTPRELTRLREQTPTSRHGSRTVIVNETNEEPEEVESPDSEPIGVLRLTGDMSSRQPRTIRWDESVIDNEHLNKKKTKICCIYHKPHVVGEDSDTESSSDSSNSESDSDSDDSRARHSANCNHNHSKRKKKNPREVSPNAYERQPVYKDRPQPSSSVNYS